MRKLMGLFFRAIHGWNEDICVSFPLSSVIRNTVALDSPEVIVESHLRLCAVESICYCPARQNYSQSVLKTGELGLAALVKIR